MRYYVSISQRQNGVSIDRDLASFLLHVTIVVQVQKKVFWDKMEGDEDEKNKIGRRGLEKRK